MKKLFFGIILSALMATTVSLAAISPMSGTVITQEPELTIVEELPSTTTEEVTEEPTFSGVTGTRSSNAYTEDGVHILAESTSVPIE